MKIIISVNIIMGDWEVVIFVKIFTYQNQKQGDGYPRDTMDTQMEIQFMIGGSVQYVDGNTQAMRKV